MGKHFHFIASYVCLQNFLSVYDKNSDNFIVCRERTEKLNEFLKDMLVGTAVKFIVVKDISLKDFFVSNQKKYLNSLLKKHFYEIVDDDVLFFYTDIYILSFFLIINSVKNQCKVRFINSEPKVSLYKIEGLKKHFTRVALQVVSLRYSIHLDLVNNSVYDLVLWNHRFENQQPDKLSWKEIKKKMEYNYSGIDNLLRSTSNNILYIHQNMNTRKSVDYQRSMENLCGFFQKMIARGKTIYFKNHPDNKEDISYIYQYVDENHIIPEFIPCELICPLFDEYYTFYSLGIMPFLKESCFSLYKLIVFHGNDPEILEFILENFKGIKLYELEDC